MKLIGQEMLHLGQTGVVAFAHVVFANGHRGQVTLAQEHGAVMFVKFELGGQTTVMFCVTQGTVVFAHEDELHNSHVKLTLSGSKNRSTYPSGHAADTLQGGVGKLVQLHGEVAVELGQKNVTFDEKLDAGHVKFTCVGHKLVTFAHGAGCVQFKAVWFAQELQLVMSR